MVRVEMVYRRGLAGFLAGGAEGVRVKWAWPVGIGEGRALLTILYTDADEVGTQILELGAEGEAKVWGPGEGYRAAVIFYANGRGELFGLDLVKRGKIYVCRADGGHCFEWETSIYLDTAVAPTNVVQVGETVFWTTAEGRRMAGDVGSGRMENVRGVEAEAGMREAGGEVRFPGTHWTRDGALWVVEWEGELRVTRYKVG